MDNSDEVERALAAIRKAGDGDLNAPTYALSLVEAARRAGATNEQVVEATDENPYWPS